MRPLIFLALVAVCLAQTGIYPNYANRIEFHTLNGKTADPCASREELGSWTSGKTDCTGNEWPESAVLVMIPSSQSQTTALPAITIQGKNLAAGTLTLSQRYMGCSAPETGLNSITATTFLVTPTLTTVVGATGDTFTLLSFTPPASWRTQNLELESSGRKLCYAVPGQAAPVYQYTGFKIGVVFTCSANTQCGTSMPTSVAFVPSATQSAVLSTDPLGTLSFFEIAVRQLRTTCCVHSTVGTVAVPLVVGQCVNPKLTDCCQGATVDPSSQRCCSSSLSLVQWYNQPCNCRPDGNPSSPTCPVNETCCTLTKYSELTAVYTTATVAAWPQAMGECFNNATHRCCDTGYRYDPGQDQCCNITGVQSLNVPCPCNADSDCQGGQQTSGQGNLFGQDNLSYCCKMSWPDPFEFADTVVARTSSRLTPYPRCNAYNNYPSESFPSTVYPLGTGPYQAQRCLGNCIDNRYQICCNGVACRKEFESCCNTTCCNKYTSTCMAGRIPGTPNTRFNGNELDQPYELCTSIEVLNPLRSFWIFVWPAYLLFMTCVCLAFVIAFISKVSRRSFSFLERSMITISFFTIIFACACYFAPIYKYGVWVVVVNMFTIIVASARSKYLNIVLVIVQFITLLYLFDPFNGNNYVGFASLRVVNGDPDPESAGILHSIHKCFHSLNSFNTRQYCVNYYNYFLKDQQLQDFRRDNILVPSFGYCGHGWITALFIFEGFTLMLTLIQFVLDLIALILRYKEQRSYEPIELEVRGEDQVPYPAY